VYDLRVVVEEVKGFCDLPMVPGDYFELKGGRLYIPPGKYMCIWALQSLIPMLPAKQREIVEENDWIPGTSRICCPDPNGMVIYRIDRIPTGPGGVGSPDQTPQSLRVEPQKVNIGHMIVDPSVCSGCRDCETVCSETHEGVSDHALSRVRVVDDEASGKRTLLVCRQCGNARCVQACPRQALSRHPITKAVLVEPTLCDGCGFCAEACPFNSPRIDPETGIVLLCDLCGGDPQCVQKCGTGALWYGEARSRPKRGQLTTG